MVQSAGQMDAAGSQRSMGTVTAGGLLAPNSSGSSLTLRVRSLTEAA